jgi:mono/diheme cytochrome c family protein
MAAFALVAPEANAQDQPKKRSGPPPIVYTELPNACARCHKSDGRGGPSYGGFAADLRATGLDHEGIVQIVTEGLRDRGMPEFESVLSKREIDGVATYIVERIKGVYLDDAGNRITAEQAAALKQKGAAKQ